MAQIVGILDGDCERHLDHNRILSQQSISVPYERTRTYMRVPHHAKSGTSIIMIVSGLHPIVDLIRTIVSKHIWSYLKRRPDHGRSCHQKLSNHDHIASKGNKSYQNVSTRITWTIVAFITDRKTKGTLHKVRTRKNPTYHILANWEYP